MLAASAVWAQGVTGSILGSVEDATGARVPGAAVAVTNMATGESRSAKADAEGNYLFPALSIGRYSLRAEAAGFKTFVSEGITLEVNQNIRIDARLVVGASANRCR